ncbi:unnamed protein product [Amoebophrya sp. A25]|nr:unnamed protein product [Amoebophrya sp. A25]|eukprot:GSA25T00007023001.1
MGNEEDVARDLQNRVALSGEGSAASQAKFLSKFMREQTTGTEADDNDWDDSFIASVTETGRERVRDHLACQIKKVLTNDDAYTPTVEELREVKNSMVQMRETKSAKESLVIEHLKLLNSWNVEEHLLKATLIGKEINNEFWKGANAPAKIQKMSKSLVQKWLREHRSIPISEINDRRIDISAASLEQNIFNFVHEKSGVKKIAYTTDYVAKYRSLTLRVRKYFTYPQRLGRQRLRELFDGEKTEAELVKTIHSWPDSYFNAKNEFVGPGKVAAPMIGSNAPMAQLPGSARLQLTNGGGFLGRTNSSSMMTRTNSKNAGGGTMSRNSSLAITQSAHHDSGAATEVTSGRAIPEIGGSIFRTGSAASTSDGYLRGAPGGGAAPTSARGTAGTTSFRGGTGSSSGSASSSLEKNASSSNAVEGGILFQSLAAAVVKKGTSTGCERSSKTLDLTSLKHRGLLLQAAGAGCDSLKRAFAGGGGSKTAVSEAKRIKAEATLNELLGTASSTGASRSFDTGAGAGGINKEEGGRVSDSYLDDIFAEAAK